MQSPKWHSFKLVHITRISVCDFLSHTPTCTHARTHTHAHIATYPLRNIYLVIACLDQLADENFARNKDALYNSRRTRYVERRKIRTKVMRWRSRFESPTSAIKREQIRNPRIKSSLARRMECWTHMVTVRRMPESCSSQNRALVTLVNMLTIFLFRWYLYHHHHHHHHHYRY
jgi:hypothetical protein